MLKRNGIALVLLFVAAPALAVPGVLGTGTNLTTGVVSIDATPPSTASNPALLKQSLGDRRYAIQGFRLPSVGIEVGPVDDFVDQLDRLERNIESAEADGDINPAEAAFLKDNFEDLLVEIGDKANVTLDIAMPVPALPIVFPAFAGVMAIHAGVAASIDINVIDGPLDIDTNNDTVDTNTAVHLRSGVFYELAVDYGQDVLPLKLGAFDGAISVGGRVKMIQGSLSRQVALLDDDGSGNDTAFDRAEESYDLNEESSTALGADIGVGFVAEGLSLGLTLRNLIPAKFDFAGIGVNCGQKPAGPERDDCNASAQFVNGYTVDGVFYPGEVAASDSFTLDPQLSLEASYVLGGGFTAFSTLDLNEVENIAKNEYQWLNVGVNYGGPWWIPAIRLGWRSNLAGSKLDVVSVGVNLFNIVSIEAFQALDSVDYDGDSTPRSAGVSIGIGGRF
ncbi:MAG: conjugal transfer protein TraF [Oceanococcus sp.]